MRIISHRGISDFSSAPESTFDAFDYNLTKHRGVEFDIVFSKDMIPIIWHDRTLSRITQNSDKRSIENINYQEIQYLAPNVMNLDEMFSLISMFDNTLSALHIKADVQDTYSLFIISQYLTKYINIHDRIIIFDLKIEAAQYIKKQFPNIKLFASVAHDYDVKRFNKFVKGTLFTWDKFIEHHIFFNGAWLDEWDTIDKQGREKQFYNKTLFLQLRALNKSIALVTPELHSKSPGLLAKECHKDGKNKELLVARCMDLINLDPDLICTDISDSLTELITK